MSQNNIPDGFKLLAGRGRENAVAAIEQAEEAGFPPESVRTTREGYLIPLSDEEREEQAKAAEEADERPNEKWTHDRIDAWAAGLDEPISFDGLEGTPTKADKIAEIERVEAERAAQKGE